MRIPALVWRFNLIFLRYLFASDLSFTFCDWHSGLFWYKYRCNTPHVNANQLGKLAMMHDLPQTWMMNVTWQHFDQSVQCCHDMTTINEHWQQRNNTAQNVMKMTSRICKCEISYLTSKDNINSIGIWSGWNHFIHRAQCRSKVSMKNLARKHTTSWSSNVSLQTYVRHLKTTITKHLIMFSIQYSDQRHWNLEKSISCSYCNTEHNSEQLCHMLVITNTQDIVQDITFHSPLGKSDHAVLKIDCK